MKTFLLPTIILLIFIVTGHAQTTISTTLQIGDITPFATASDATASTVNVNITGSNVTWDCSGLLPDPEVPVMNLTVSSPAGTQYSSDYPFSNWYWTDPALISFVGHHYYSFTPDSLALWGEHTQGSSYEIYDNPEMELKLPFSYGDTYSNSYSKTNYDAGGNMTSYQTGLNTLNYDAWGTLMLPSGTFENVGRIKNTRTNSLGPTTVAYDWYIISSGERIMHYGTNGGISVAYRNEMPTGTGDKDNLLESEFFPNPFIQQSVFTISSGSVSFPCFLKIFDMNGRLVRTAEVTTEKTIIRQEELKSGVYFYALEGDNRVRSGGKLIIY